MTDRRRGGGGGETAAQLAAREVYREILGRAKEHEVDPTLEPVREVCALLGDPQRALRVVHVTGTNGKTSTARMLERLLREHGLRTGRFTSPHLTDVRERIAIDGEPVSAELFVAVYHEVLPSVRIVDERLADQGRAPLSFFGVLTVMAFAAFADAPVDVAVIEVGMGGRWDYTNVVDGEVAVITPVDLDHQRWLGHDLASIAREKAGIIKPGAVVVLGQQQPEVADIVAESVAAAGATALRDGVELAVADRQVAVGGQLLALSTPGGLYTGVFLPLHGEHQAHNALLALAAAEAVLTDGGALDAATVEVGFAEVDSPGRLEVVRRSPTILVDAAHNPSGAQALVAALDEAFGFTRLIGVVGILADKDAENILGVLEPVLDEVVVTRSASPRAIDVTDLAEIAVDVFGEDRVHAVERLDEAIDLAVQRAEGGAESGSGVLVTGSITVVAETRMLLGRT